MNTMCVISLRRENAKQRVLTVLSLVSANSWRTLPLCFCANFPSNLKNSKFFLFSGISKRSKNEVHWLNIMLFSPEPELRICSKHSKSLDIFDDSFQFFSISILNLLPDGHVIRSDLLIICLQMGQMPWAGVLQLDSRHSLHILCAQGVNTGSSADSRQMGHSEFSPLRRPSTTSSTYARDGAVPQPASECGWRNLLASLFKSAYSCVSPRLQTS